MKKRTEWIIHEQWTIIMKESRMCPSLIATQFYIRLKFKFRMRSWSLMLEITDRSLQPISVCLRLLIYRSFKNFKNTFCTFVLLFWNVGTILHNLFVPYRNNCSPGTTPSPRCDLKIRLQSLYLIRFSSNTFTVPLFNPFLFKYVYSSFI